MRSKTSLTVFYDHLRFNIQNLRHRAPKNKILFMVKANAYGHGMLEIAGEAVQSGEISALGVATLDEAFCLRKELQIYDTEIYVFSELALEDPNRKLVYRNYKVIPVISSMHDLKIFLSDDQFVHVPLVIMLNTGMNRLGIDQVEIDQLWQQLKLSKRKSIYHLMTHFSCSYHNVTSDPTTYEQIERFSENVKTLKDQGIEIQETSVSNSGAILQEVGLEHSYIRPGLMLYGPSGLSFFLDRKPWESKIISRLEAEVLQRRVVEKGDRVGYGGRKLNRSGLLVTLGIGYGDGISTHYQKLPIYTRQFQGEIFGRVSMDMTTVLFSKKAREELGRTSTIILWDEDPQRIDEICRVTGTIPYEIFCSITSRVPKCYRNSQSFHLK
jgi:alanine racemase